jgi:hypothetical protein
MTQQAAMSVLASLATLVMDIHVWTLMSVLPILVTVPTIMGASPVSATLDFQEMEPFVMTLMSVLTIKTTAL